MPELPEVETIRRDLDKTIVGLKIIDVEVLDAKVVKTKNLKIILKNNEFTSVDRRGKLLCFNLKTDGHLLVHLKMTGQLIYKDHKIIAGGHHLTASDLQVPNKFTRVIISFSNKTKLYFNDLRRFGYLKIVDDEEKQRIWENDFGIEPLTKDFTLENFSKLFHKRKTNLKAILMNQKLISGIGNIYADEICFCAKVKPNRSVSSLKDTDVNKLFDCTESVLKIAIKNRGTTFKDFVDSEGKKGKHSDFLNVYGHDGEKCKRCSGVIKKVRAAGRGTHYCSNCQK